MTAEPFIMSPEQRREWAKWRRWNGIRRAMAASDSGSAASDTDITFTNSAVGAADVDYVAVYSAITGGTLMASTQVTAKSVSIGDSLKILSGQLTFAIT